MDLTIIVPALVGVLTVLFLKSRITDKIRILVREVTVQHSTLPFPPNSLTRLETVVLFLLATLKHGLKLANYFGDLEYNEQDYVLPGCSVTASMTITETDVAAFGDVFPAQEHSKRLATKAGQMNDFFLPCITSVMIPFLLVKFKTPVSPLGVLNTKNRFEYINLKVCSQPVGITVLTATLGGDRNGRRTRKGREVDIYVQARLNGQKDSYFRQIFTVLELLPSHAMPLYDESRHKIDGRVTLDSSPASSSCEITVSHDAPWLWARFCKDYNPIHISTFVAHLFGFGGRLVHGNHLAAMAINESGSLLQSPNITQSLSKTAKQSKGKKPILSDGRYIEVKFIKPVILGSTVEVLSTTDNIMLKRREQTVITIRAGNL